MNDRDTTNSYTRPGLVHDRVSVNTPWMIVTRQTATQHREGCMIGFQSTHHEWSWLDKQLQNTGTDAWYGFSQHTMNDRITTNSYTTPGRMHDRVSVNTPWMIVTRQTATKHRDGCMILFHSTHHEWSHHDKQLHNTGTDAWYGFSQHTMNDGDTTNIYTTTGRMQDRVSTPSL